MMDLWKLRIFQPYISSIAYVELLRTAREEGNIDWLTVDWFFEDELKVSKEVIAELIKQVKKEECYAEV